MNMDFKSAKELLDLCEENQLPISEVMRQRECLLGETPRDAVDHRMAKAWEIMHASATQPLKKPIKSMGGLIGGEAKKLETHYNKKKSICGDVLQKAMTYAMAVLEVNASMGLIVAAPTAGSAGVVPGMMLALQECYRISDQRIVDALFNAGAVGYLAMRNATVAGAVGGCQAEVGIASAMAASAAVELMGGNPQQCLDAASTVLMNMLGIWSRCSRCQMEISDHIRSLTRFQLIQSKVVRICGISFCDNTNCKSHLSRNSILRNYKTIMRACHSLSLKPRTVNHLC